MSGSHKRSSLAKAILVMVIGGFLVKAALDSHASILPVLPKSNKTPRGEYGGDLDFLRRFHVGPQASNESNHYIDMWSPGTLPALAKANGLTNNRALFVEDRKSVV